MDGFYWQLKEQLQCQRETNSPPTQRALDRWDAYASNGRIQRLGIFRYIEPRLPVHQQVTLTVLLPFLPGVSRHLSRLVPFWRRYCYIYRIYGRCIMDSYHFLQQVMRLLVGLCEQQARQGQ